MKKFKPAIIIWAIDIRDKDTGVIVHQEFFLFYKRAKRCYNQCLEWIDTDCFEIGLGGEPLRLW